MKNKINDIITKYKELRNDAWNNYRNICHQEQKEIVNILNFENKYLKILDGETHIYLYVVNQYCNQEDNGYSYIRFIGPGVRFYIFNDSEYIYGEFDEEFTYELKIHNLENIETISREEFIVACKKCFTDSKKYFINLLR